MSAFDWLRINNKYGFKLANRFAQRKISSSFSDECLKKSMQKYGT